MLNDHSSGGSGHDPQQNSPEHRPEPNPPAPGAGPPQGPYGPPAEYPYQQGGYPPPPGNYPPPPGNYPPPPGNYPPPPGNYPPQGGCPSYPQGYNQFPPGPQQYGPPQQYGTQPATLSVGAALTYGWKKFVANIGVWLAFMALFGGLLVAFYIVAVAVVFTTMLAAESTEDSAFASAADGTGFSVGTMVMTSIAGILGFLASAVLIRGALLELDGVRPGFGAFWRLPNVGQLVLFGIATAVISGVVNTVDPFVSLAFSLLLGIAIWFAVQFILDRGMSALTSVVANIRLLGSSPGQLALLYLALVGINLVGAVLCGIGLIFTVPMTMIATTYAYRVLTGGPVSPAT
ncbi:hypothetical protein [Rhodococcus sp. EPR-157]|uniref:hypothetical protein n=1 Tax=Rhodococcus sp. EPR-157 TaxID=1813677 RepID=UPI0008386B64|nr:hypothetical protein [Rhodococcus sp. EPR-157]